MASSDPRSPVLHKQLGGEEFRAFNGAIAVIVTEAQAGVAQVVGGHVLVLPTTSFRYGSSFFMINSLYTAPPCGVSALRGAGSHSTG